MSQAQAASLGVAELSKKYADILNYIHANLPGGTAKQTAVQALLTARDAAVSALTG
jgi:hypothetical protein